MRGQALGADVSLTLITCPRCLTQIQNRIWSKLRSFDRPYRSTTKLARILFTLAWCWFFCRWGLWLAVMNSWKQPSSRDGFTIIAGVILGTIAFVIHCIKQPVLQTRALSGPAFAAARLSAGIPAAVGCIDSRRYFLWASGAARVFAWLAASFSCTASSDSQMQMPQTCPGKPLFQLSRGHCRGDWSAFHT